jgi:tetratricopeptide (TPR) repeat protein
LGRLRAAFAAGEYSDDLQPYLERALAQAPTFYQPPFLLAAFHANRLERPDVIDNSFEAAIARFPSNGRLHLTYAEWLLTPRATAAYRSYRATPGADERDAAERAMRHVGRATALEPDLVRRALEVLLRFRVPVDSWAIVLPEDETTRRLILHAVDRAPRDRPARRELLRASLSQAREVATLELVSYFGRNWNEPEIALDASETWYQKTLADGTGSDITKSALSLARDCLDNAQPDRAYDVVRNTVSTLAERELGETNAELLVGAGDLYLARGRIAMAQSLFTEAATSFPYHAKAYLGLALTYQRAGDPESAIVELERVLELDPENNQARTLLTALLERR